MCERSTGGAEFGLQPLLYLNTMPGTQKAGAGLNAVGTLVRVWGHTVLASSPSRAGDVQYLAHWIDDGSGIAYKTGDEGGVDAHSGDLGCAGELAGA